MQQETNTTWSADELKARALDLIEAQTTMTLATARRDVAWAAPVYYVFLKGGFYFFSKPVARHIIESLEGGQASAAIHAQAATWKDIRGLQMSGTVREAHGALETMGAIGRYLQKFGFTREFFSKEQTMDLAGFRTRFGVGLYRFQPNLVYYLDNSLKFGFREPVILM